MSIDINEYLTGRYNLFLETVDYKRIESNLDVTQYAVLCSDSMEVTQEDKILKIKFIRKATMNPSDVFLATVTLGAEFEIDENKSLDSDVETIKESLIENASHILFELSTRASLVVSQLTAMCGQIPVITSPRCMFKGENDK